MSRSAEVNAPDDAVRDLLDTARAGSVEDFGRLIAGLHDYLLLVANRELTPNVLRQNQRLGRCTRNLHSGAAQDRGLRRGHDQRTTGLAARHPLEQDPSGRTTVHRRASATYAVKLYSTPGTHRPVAKKRYWIDGNRQVGTRSSRSGQPPLTKCWGACRANTRGCCGWYWEQLSLDEIAQQMNRSADAVQKLWFRAWSESSGS